MILLLTHSGDFYTIDRVKMSLDEMGAKSAIVHTDRYPQFCALSSEFTGSCFSFAQPTVAASASDARIVVTLFFIL